MLWVRCAFGNVSYLAGPEKYVLRKQTVPEENDGVGICRLLFKFKLRLSSFWPLCKF